MDSLEISNFLFPKVEETIKLKEYIEEVSIAYKFEEGFGNKYIKLYYTVYTSKKFDLLAFREQEQTFVGKPHYIFQLSSHSHRFLLTDSYIYSRIIEFKQIYLSLTSYIAAQLEKHLNPETPIKIQGIDLKPQFNYAEKYFNSILNYGYEKDMNSKYKNDISQWPELHQLAVKSKKIYSKEKECFKITDKRLTDLYDLSLDNIRSIIISYCIPIKIQGVKTVDEIHIHVPQLIEALNQKIKNEHLFAMDKFTYLRLLDYLYDNYAFQEKVALTIARSPIRSGDIVRLKNNRIVIAQKLLYNKRYQLKYLILKVNLEKSYRSGLIDIKFITHFAKSQKFEEYCRHNPVKNLKILNRWLSKNQEEFSFH